MKDRNSTTNQEIKRKLVDREVICLFSYPMEACLAAGRDGAADMPVMEDIENYFTYPEYIGTYADFSGGTEEQRQEEIERLELEVEDVEEELSDLDNFPSLDRQNEIVEIAAKIRAEIEGLKDLESEPQEIFEWWIVADYLSEKLKERGEPVIEWNYLNIWGRTTTGQAILLDSVISDIAEEMEILEGQKNSWA